MFEQPASDPVPQPAGARVLAPEGDPIEFLYRGNRFHNQKHLEQSIFNDGGRAIWRVEAAPVGALATFEIELDELTGTWTIRPTSRPS